MKENNEINTGHEELSYLHPVGKLDAEIEKINNNFKHKKLRRISMSELNLYGVENLKKVGVAVASLIDAGMKSKSDDGKFTWSDIAHFVKIIPNIIAAIPALSHVKNELKDKITDSEYKDFKKTVMQHVEIKNDTDNEFISELLDIIFSISKLVKNRIEKTDDTK
jgi:hypothetical protein